MMKTLKKLETLTIAASLLAVFGTVSANAQIASTSYGGDEFYLYAGNNSWAADEAAANALGGYLAILPNQAAITAVYNGLINNGFFVSGGGGSQAVEAYIGAIPADGSENVTSQHNVAPANDWSWVTSVPAGLYDGSPVHSVVPWTVGGNFNAGEPNGDSEGLALNRYGTSTFNDEGSGTGGYIVEIGKVPGAVLVRERGLEPPPLAGPDPKSGVSAIPPLALAVELTNEDGSASGSGVVISSDGLVLTAGTRRRMKGPPCLLYFSRRQNSLRQNPWHR
jgi:hypothetical protein